MVIAPEQLSPEALLGVIDAFVLQEGTDYGHDDVALESKRAAVLAQLTRGEVKIVFDPVTETVNIVPSRHLASA